MRFTHAVFEEVERVRGDFPVGDELGHVVVDREIGVLVDGLTDATEVPTVFFRNELEAGEVEWPVRGDDEVVADTRIVVHDPLCGPWEEEAVVPPPSSERLCARMGRLNQRDPAIGVDSEDRGMRVQRRAIVHPHAVAALQHGLVTTVEPHTRLERRVICPFLGAQHGRDDGDQQTE